MNVDVSKRKLVPEVLPNSIHAYLHINADFGPVDCVCLRRDPREGLNGSDLVMQFTNSPLPRYNRCMINPEGA